jgi:hypothetical protein
VTDQSAAEAKKQYIEKMGDALGTRFYALWQEITLLHINWKEYAELFGTSEKRIERLNQAAPAFFRMIQDELWNATLLHIARLVDSPKTSGQANLTIRNLTDLVDVELKMPLATLIDKAVEDAKFARDWRNKIIAHRDLSLALEDGTSEPLTPASRADVNKALAELAEVLNAVQHHYLNSETIFNAAARHNGAITLLYHLGDGLKIKTEREKYFEALAEGSKEYDQELLKRYEQEQI